jgi:hypothetical protein
MSTNLRDALLNFSKIALKTIKEGTDTSFIVKSYMCYVKNNVEYHINRNAVGSIPSLSWTHTYDMRDEIYLKNEYKFFEKYIRPLQAFKKCIEEMPETSIYEDKGFLLQQFIFKLNDKANLVSYQYDGDFLNRQINLFMNDIYHAPIDWNTKIFMYGLDLEEDRYEFSYKLEDGTNTRMVIRKTILSDFNMEWPINSKPLFGELNTPILTSAVIDFTVKCPYLEYWKAHIEIEKILDILRLYRVGTVIALKWERTPMNSFIMDSSYSLYSIEHSQHSKYVLNMDDIMKLESFINKIGSALPSISKYRSNDLLYLNMAFENYKYAIIKHGDVLAPISFAITGLETLYKIKDEPGRGNARKVSERVFSVLKLFNVNDDNIKDNIIKAYEIRDSVYHGFVLSNEQITIASEIYISVMNYLRISLQIFLQVKKNKEELLSKIRPLADEPENDNLKRDLKQLIGNDIFIIM